MYTELMASLLKKVASFGNTADRARNPYSLEPEVNGSADLWVRANAQFLLENSYIVTPGVVASNRPTSFFYSFA
jgi:hypothetical protein